MANYYKNAFYDPNTSTAITVYSCPSNSRAIIQNIQLANAAGSTIVQVYISSAISNISTQVSYASISGPTTCNLANGTIILQESDSISIASSNISSISGIISILEMNRNDANGP